MFQMTPACGCPCWPAPVPQTAGHDTVYSSQNLGEHWFPEAFPAPPPVATRPRPSSPADTGAPHLLSVGADAADKEGLCLAQRLQELVKGCLGKEKQGI